MGSTATYKPRKATFTQEGKGKDRIFTPVNKRAKTVVRKAGKRTKVTLEQLHALKDTGSYTYYVYTKKGVLAPLKV